jgi:hypothetical protein
MQLSQSHRELVETAERLMNELPDAERLLHIYDAALASENDVLLTKFCRRLQRLAQLRARSLATASRRMAA